MSSSAQMIHDEHHRALVRRLAAELKPTRSMWPVSIRLALWMALEIGILMWVMTGSGRNVIGRLKEPAYAMEALFFGFAAVILAALALRSAIPGRFLSTLEATIAGLLVLAGTLLITASVPMDTARSVAEFVRVGLQCALRIGLYSALPLAALWWMIVRGASMQGGLSGLLTGGSAVFFAMTILRLECPNNEPLHILIWHLLPALLLAMLSALAGSRWLKFRLSRIRPRPDAANDRTQPII
jgi:hypothetical protein